MRCFAKLVLADFSDNWQIGWEAWARPRTAPPWAAANSSKDAPRAFGGAPIAICLALVGVL